MEYPHCPAAFINAIADEGTKAEAVEWLQKTWNELMLAHAAIRAADSAIHACEGVSLLNYMAIKSDEGRYVAGVVA